MQDKNRGPAAGNKVRGPYAEGTVQNFVKDGVSAKKRSETTLQNKERQVDGWHPMETCLLYTSDAADE